MIEANDNLPQGPPRARGLGEVTIQVLVMCALLAALIVVTSSVNANILTPVSVRSICRDVAIMSLFALGQAVVIISGGIDLSVGSLMCFLGVVAVMICGAGGELLFPVAVLTVVGLAVAVGLIHGLLLCWFDLQPFLVTLCSLLVFRGLARVLTSDRTVSFDATAHPIFAAIGSGAWCGVPNPVFVLVGVLLPLGFFMHCTVPGRYLYALGSNLEAARYSGIRVNALRTVSYVLCALLSAIAALLEASDVGSVTPSNAGTAYEMYAITAAVLGGCALRGGQGSLVGVIVGAAILRVIRSAVIFLEISTYWTLAVTGLVLLSAVMIDSLLRRRRAP